MASDRYNPWDDDDHVTRSASTKQVLGAAYLSFSFLCLMLAAWLTHVYVCLKEEHWGFLIGGAIFFPIAVVHGVLIWLGIVG